MGLLTLTADKIVQIFGFRKHKRLRGKFYAMLEKINHGRHILRVYAKDAVARMYEKFSTFLRVEGVRVALMFVLFHKRVCGPLAGTSSVDEPQASQQPASRIEAAYHKADAAVQNILDQHAHAA